METKTVNKDYLQFYRLKKGLTQSELKEQSNYPYIGKVERGQVVLSYDDANDRTAMTAIRRIAKALKIKPEQLLCLDEKAAAENADANKFASLNLSAMRRARHVSHKEVGVCLGFPEKNAGLIIIEFERGRLMLPPDELTRIAAEVFVGDSDEWREKQKDFLTREFTSAEIVYIYSGGAKSDEPQQENNEDELEDTAVSDDDFTVPESDRDNEYELHLADGRVITVKGSRYGGDVCYEFYIARKNAVLEYVKSDGDVFICRKKDIFYIIRKGDEK